MVTMAMVVAEAVVKDATVVEDVVTAIAVAITVASAKVVTVGGCCEW